MLVNQMVAGFDHCPAIHNTLEKKKKKATDGENIRTGQKQKRNKYPDTVVTKFAKKEVKIDFLNCINIKKR